METVITIDAYWLNFALGVVLPAAVALVTKANASSALKAWLLVGLSTLTAVLTQFAGGFTLSEFVTAFAVTFITAICAHYGLLKPTHVTGSDGAVANAVPGGLGKEYEPRHKIEEN